MPVSNRSPLHRGGHSRNPRAGQGPPSGAAPLNPRGQRGSSQPLCCSSSSSSTTGSTQASPGFFLAQNTPRGEMGGWAGGSRARGVGMGYGAERRNYLGNALRRPIMGRVSAPPPQGALPDWEGRGEGGVKKEACASPLPPTTPTHLGGLVQGRF